MKVRVPLLQTCDCECACCLTGRQGLRLRQQKNENVPRMQEIAWMAGDEARRRAQWTSACTNNTATPVKFERHSPLLLCGINNKIRSYWPVGLGTTALLLLLQLLLHLLLLPSHHHVQLPRLLSHCTRVAGKCRTTGKRMGVIQLDGAIYRCCCCRCFCRCCWCCLL